MAGDRLTVKTSFSLGPSRDGDVPFAGGMMMVVMMMV